MATIALIRHGETDWNAETRLQGQTDVPLNKHGRKQAKEVAKYLKKYRWDHIYSSPLSRARTTAEIISNFVGVRPVLVREGLRERAYGEAEGMTEAQRLELYPDRNYPGMEPWGDLNARVIGTLKELCFRHPHDNVIVVAHGGAINAAIHTITYGVFGTGKTVLHLGGVTFINHKGSEMRLEMLNEKVTSD